MNNKLILKAATFAAKAHSHQSRRYHKTPYINHPLRVAESAALAGLSSNALAAALLHDVVEDTDVGLQQLQIEFPKRVVEIVNLLSKWWPDFANGPEIDKNKAQYYQQILQDKDATAIKLLDRADNLSDFGRCLPEALDEAQGYLNETKYEFPELLKNCENEIVRSIYSQSILFLESELGKICL